MFFFWEYIAKIKYKVAKPGPYTFLINIFGLPSDSPTRNGFVIMLSGAKNIEESWIFYGQRTTNNNTGCSEEPCSSLIFLAFAEFWICREEKTKSYVLCGKIWNCIEPGSPFSVFVNDTVSAINREKLTDYPRPCHFCIKGMYTCSRNRRVPQETVWESLTKVYKSWKQISKLINLS